MAREGPTRQLHTLNQHLNQLYDFGKQLEKLYQYHGIPPVFKVVLSIGLHSALC